MEQLIPFVKSLSAVKNANSEYPSVVFDSYGFSTTKSCEQKRRKTCAVPCADIIITENTPVPKDKQSFLANEHNKQALINLLAKYLENARVETIHAGDEGDADVIIVKMTLQSTEKHPIVKVVADDTDIFILLLFHLKDTMDTILETQKHSLSIRGIWQKL